MRVHTETSSQQRSHASTNHIANRRVYNAIIRRHNNFVLGAGGRRGNCGERGRAHDCAHAAAGAAAVVNDGVSEGRVTSAFIGAWRVGYVCAFVCVCGRSCALAWRSGKRHEDFTVCLVVCAGGMRLRIRYHEGFPGKSLKCTQSTLGDFYVFLNFFPLQIFIVQYVFLFVLSARAKRREAATEGLVGASSFINETILSISADYKPMSSASSFSVLDVFYDSDDSSVLSIDDAPRPSAGTTPPTSLKPLNDRRILAPFPNLKSVKPANFIPFKNRKVMAPTAPAPRPHTASAGASSAPTSALLRLSDERDAASALGNLPSFGSLLHSLAPIRTPRSTSSFNASAQPPAVAAEAEPMAARTRADARLDIPPQMSLSCSARASSRQLSLPPSSSIPSSLPQSASSQLPPSASPLPSSFSSQRLVNSSDILRLIDTMRYYGHSIDWGRAVHAVLENPHGGLEKQVRFCLSQLSGGSMHSVVRPSDLRCIDRYYDSVSSFGGDDDDDDNGDDAEDDGYDDNGCECECSQCDAGDHDACGCREEFGVFSFDSHDESDGSSNEDASDLVTHIPALQPRRGTSIRSVILLSKQFAFESFNASGISSPVVPTRPLHDSPYVGTLNVDGKQEGRGVYVLPFALRADAVVVRLLPALCSLVTSHFLTDTPILTAARSRACGATAPAATAKVNASMLMAVCLRASSATTSGRDAACKCSCCNGFCLCGLLSHLPALCSFHCLTRRTAAPTLTAASSRVFGSMTSAAKALATTPTAARSTARG